MRLKHLARLHTSVEDPTPRPIVDLEALASGTGRLAAGVKLHELSEPGEGVAQVAEGDVLFGKLRPYLAKSWVADRPCFASAELLCLRPAPGVSSRWFGYVVASRPFVEFAVATSDGAKMPRTSWIKLGELRLGVPDHGVQQSIADYLDRETARIDALITAKQRVVESLTERRIALAHATVSGTQVDGSRQASGNDWMGSIPAHWRMARLGSLFDVQLGRMLNGERRTGPDMRPYIRNVNVRWGSVDTSDLAEMNFPPEGRIRYALKPGDLLVNEGGAGIGRAAIWDGRIDEIYYQKSVHRIRPRGELSVQWLLEWFRVAVDRRVFEVEGNLATIPHVPAEALRRFRVPVPPKAEEVKFLSALTGAVQRDELIGSITQKQINLLRERREALVDAAVTGQLSIAEAA